MRDGISMNKHADRPIERLSLATRYAAFALFSTAVNWAMQLAILRTIPGRFSIYAALFVGTGAGFVVKYLLDKNYIFQHASANRTQEAWVLALYLGTSIVMTAFYLVSQAVIFFVYGEGVVYYASGTAVLLLGYAIKFALDGRFVFGTTAFGELAAAHPGRSDLT